MRYILFISFLLTYCSYILSQASAGSEEDVSLSCEGILDGPAISQDIMAEAEKKARWRARLDRWHELNLQGEKLKKTGPSFAKFAFTAHVDASMKADILAAHASGDIASIDAYCMAYLDRIVDSKLCDYGILQMELVSTEGSPHLQCYVECHPKQRVNALKIGFDMGCHFDGKVRERDSARNYCGKPDLSHPEDKTRISSRYFEFGEWIGGKARKNKLLPIAMAVREGTRLSQIAEMAPDMYVMHHRGLRALANTIQRPLTMDGRNVTLFYGPPGVGKSRLARDGLDPSEVWVAPAGGFQWFDGYEGQPYALWDDFDGKRSSFGLGFLLQLLDRYTIRVPVKGDYVPWLPQHVYITTNFHPKDWYDWSDRAAQYVALQRRFTRVYYWRTSGDVNPSSCTPGSPQWEAWWAGPPAPQRVQLGPMDLFVEHQEVNQWNWPGI